MNIMCVCVTESISVPKRGKVNLIAGKEVLFFSSHPSLSWKHFQSFFVFYFLSVSIATCPLPVFTITAFNVSMFAGILCLLLL